MKEVLAVRQKRNKPRFVRQDINKKKRLRRTWRRPKGLHSKMRRSIRGKPSVVSIGWGNPKAGRHLSKAGLLPILISTLSELGAVNPQQQEIVISSTLGTKKKMPLVKAAQEKGITISNMKDPSAFIKHVEETLAKKKEEKAKKKVVKDEKKKTLVKKSEEIEASEKKEKPEDLAGKVAEEDKKKEEKKEKDKVLTKKGSL